MSIEVHDTGPGLSGKQFRLAMERSVRLATTCGAAEGHGLGLSIVAQLTRRHELPLRHAGGEGRGTCVAVEVPRAPEQWEAVPATVRG